MSDGVNFPGGMIVTPREGEGHVRTSLSFFFFFFLTPPAVGSPPPPLSLRPPFTTCW